MSQVRPRPRYPSVAPPWGVWGADQRSGWAERTHETLCPALFALHAFRHLPRNAFATFLAMLGGSEIPTMRLASELTAGCLERSRPSRVTSSTNAAPRRCLSSTSRTSSKCHPQIPRCRSGIDRFNKRVGTSALGAGSTSFSRIRGSQLPCNCWSAVSARYRTPCMGVPSRLGYPEGTALTVS